MKIPSTIKFKSFSDLSLKWKLQLVIVSISFLMLLISFTAITFDTIEDFRKDQLREARRLAGMTTEYCRQDFKRSGGKHLEEILSALKNTPEVEAAAVYSRGERRLARYRINQNISVPDSVPSMATAYYQHDKLHVFEHIMINGKNAGTIYLRLSTDYLENKIESLLWTMLVFFSILVFFAFLISFKLQKYISYPILRLAKTTREIASLEDYSVKVKKFGNDEVGELYDSFNIMLDQIYKRDLQRNRAMRALRESEERYRKVIELSPNGILLHHKEKIIYANPKALQMAAVPRLDMILGANIFEYIHPDYKKNKTRQTARAMVDGKTVPVIEEKFIRSDGQILDTMIAAVPFGSSSEGSETILTVIQDITEFNQAQKALRQSEARFRQIIEKSNDAMYVLVDRRFVLVNPRMQDLFGYDEEELIGKSFNPMHLVAEESRRFIVKNERAFSNGQDSLKQYQFKAMAKDGHKFELEANLSRVNWDGKPAVLGILRDITQQKQLEEQLRQSQKMEAIGTLAGGVAHDFNNLLTVISGHIELAQLKLPKEDPINRHINEIDKAGKRAQNLTRQLLAFSRKQIIKRKSLDFNNVIEDMEKMLNRLIGEDIVMQLDLAASLPSVVADPGQLEQIVMNLVINARDAIRENSASASKKEIRIETALSKLQNNQKLSLGTPKKHQYIVLTISDTGKGMDAETRSKIFEPFFTTKGQGKGTGLGMATIYGIVKQNEGNIHVYSEPGQGTVIKVYWPILEGTVSEESGTSEETHTQPQIGNETILFVEDDRGVREFAVTALKDLGYVIHEAEDAEHALRLVQEDKIKFDLMVTDLVMPGKSGKELADQMDEIVPDLRVLFASGYTESNIVNQGILNDGINFIHKPYSVRDLSEKIRNILQNSKRRSNISTKLVTPINN